MTETTTTKLEIDFNSIIESIVAKNTEALIAPYLKDDLVDLASEITKEVVARVENFAKTAIQDAEETNVFIENFSLIAEASNRSNFTKLKNRLRFLSKKENPPQYAVQLSKVIQNIEFRKNGLRNIEINEDLLLEKAELICLSSLNDLIDMEYNLRTIKNDKVGVLDKIDYKAVVKIMLKRNSEALFLYYLYKIENKSIETIQSEYQYKDLVIVKKLVRDGDIARQNGRTRDELRKCISYHLVPVEEYYAQNASDYSFCVDNLEQLGSADVLKRVSDGFIVSISHDRNYLVGYHYYNLIHLANGNSFIDSVDGKCFAKISHYFDLRTKKIIFGINKTSIIAYDIIEKRCVVLPRDEYEEQSLLDVFGAYNGSRVVYDNSGNLFDRTIKECCTFIKQNYMTRFHDQSIGKHREVELYEQCQMIYAAADIARCDIYERIKKQLSPEQQAIFEDKTLFGENIRFKLSHYFRLNPEVLPEMQQELYILKETVEQERAKIEKQIQEQAQEEKKAILSEDLEAIELLEDIIS